MTGLDGINSLQKALGALKTNDPASVKDVAQAAATTAPSSANGNPKPGTTPAASLDHTSLSAAAQATSASDVRMNRVTELRQAIASGSYNVPSHDVASRIVDSLLR